MKRKPGIDMGALCVRCKVSAVECQHIFTDSHENLWCCSYCRTNGPMAAHTINQPTQGES